MKSNSALAARDDAHILVCLLAGLGDAIMASPMLRAIREQRPSWKIDTVTAMRATQAYVEALPGLKRAEHEDFLDYPLWLKLVKLLRLRNRAYDAVILPYPASRWQYHFGAMTIATFGLIAHRYGRIDSILPGYRLRSPICKSRHVVDLNADLLAGLGLEVSFDRRYQFPEGWNLPSIREPDGTIAFHLVSLDSAINKGNYHKSPSIATYAAAAKGLRARGHSIAMVGAGKELALHQEFERECGFPVEVITGSLQQSAARLRRVSVVVASESGVAHLSAALEVPLVCVFAMTDPIRFAPIGDVAILRPSECPPCYDPSDRRFACKRQIDFKCIQRDLTADHIIAAVVEKVGEPAPADFARL